MAPSRNTHSRRKTVRGPPIIEDVLINILSRLPVKSILRFKCVSKTWQSLISDPYLQRILPTIMSGLFYTFFERNVGRCKYKFIPNRSLPNTNNVSIKDVDDLSFFPHHQHEFCILNCCNGLLLVQALESITSNIPAYYVINPATKKWAALPHGPKEHIRTNFMLAFDPLVSPHYTLICWGRLFLGVDIFSSKTGLWVHFKVPLELVTQPQQLLSAFPAVLLNRTLHMLSEHDSIVGFDLDEECFSLIPLPGPTQRNLQKCLGVSGGYLYYANHDSSQLQIWMLEEYDEHKWVLKHQTTINSLVQKRQLIHFLCFHHECSGYSEYYRNNFRLFAFHPDFEALFLEMGGTLFSYHLNSTKLEKVWGLNPMYNGTHYQQSIYWQSIYPFSPCLENFYDRKWC